MKKSILIVDEMHPSLFKMLEEIAFKYDYLPHIKREAILEILPKYDGLIIRSKTKIDKEFLAKADNLKFIGRAGAGLDLIDIKEAENRNIQLFSANEGNRDAVAEHTIGMILALFNKLTIANFEVKNNIWQREPNRGIELMGKTWAIIGYGNNGKATAKRLSGFGVNVIAYDKFNTDFSDGFASAASMNYIFENADIVSLHIPLNKETNKMVDQDFIKKFKKNIFLVNIARGEIVVLKELLAELKSGKVAGACLDVLENEKIVNLSNDERFVFDELVALPNTILTPHIAGWTHESYIKINEVLVSKIKQFSDSQ